MKNTLIIASFALALSAGRASGLLAMLTINPDARSWAMGQSGVALPDNAFAAYYNPGAFVSIDKRFDIGLSHCNWLPELASNQNLNQIWANIGLGKDNDYKLGRIGLGFQHIDVDNPIEDDDINAISYEYALAISYAIPIVQNSRDRLGFGVTGRFIHSKLNHIVYVGQVRVKPTGNDFAFDMGIYYSNLLKKMDEYEYRLNTGLSLANIGPKMQYPDADISESLPSTLKAGYAFEYILKPKGIPRLRLIQQFDLTSSLLNLGDDRMILEWHRAPKSFGLEAVLNDVFSFRGGYIFNYDYYPKSDCIDKVNTTGYSFDPADWIGNNYWTIGMGVKVFKGAVKLDIAYITKSEDPEYNNQYLPLSGTVYLTLSGTMPTFNLVK
jgi:hypothetical protein